jgi:hypothetical protein
MLDIRIKTIPHKKQLYDTCGDWRFNHWGDTEIRVSEVGNYYYEFLVALHELIEATLCRKRGISESSVSKFDIKFEELRKKGKVKGEPGNSKKAPYRKEHRFATKIEKLMAKELGIKWTEYDNSIGQL